MVGPQSNVSVSVTSVSMSSAARVWRACRVRKTKCAGTDKLIAGGSVRVRPEQAIALFTPQT